MKREVDVMRVAIEDAVVAAKGEVGLYDAATIQSAMRWERHAMLAQRWLRLSINEMDAATKLSYSREIARASTERDKCLERLGLNVSDVNNAIDALYADTPLHAAPNATNGGEVSSKAGETGKATLAKPESEGEAHE